jgi:hypothetical protein
MESRNRGDVHSIGSLDTLIKSIHLAITNIGIVIRQTGLPAPQITPSLIFLAIKSQRRTQVERNHFVFLEEEEFAVDVKDEV